MDGQNRNSVLVFVLVGLALLALLVLGPLLTMPMMIGMMGGMGQMMGGGGYWSGWPMMLLFWALLIGGIALVAAWLYRQGYIGTGGSRSATPASATATSGANHAPRTENSGNEHLSQDALDILKQRYARGEIDREQYEQMKRDILAD